MTGGASPGRSTYRNGFASQRALAGSANGCIAAGTPRYVRPNSCFQENRGRGMLGHAVSRVGPGSLKPRVVSQVHPHNHLILCRSLIAILLGPTPARSSLRSSGGLLIPSRRPSHSPSRSLESGSGSRRTSRSILNMSVPDQTRSWSSSYSGPGNNLRFIRRPLTLSHSR